MHARRRYHVHAIQHSALRSPSQRCFVEMLFVSQRALQRTYRRAGTLRSMDCVGSRCCIRLMMRLAVRLEVIGLSASRMSQGEHLRDVTGLVFGQTGLSQLAPGMAPGLCVDLRTRSHRLLHFKATWNE